MGDAVFSVVAAIAIGVWRGPLWDVRAATAICVLAFGIWGVADRELTRFDLSRRMSLVARAARAGAALVGFAAAGYAMMALLGRAIGRVIS